jgi:hypothetical protein
MMSDLAVKNCWTLAEHAGHDSPDGLQHLLRKAKWDSDGVRDDLESMSWNGSARSMPCWWWTRPAI